MTRRLASLAAAVLLALTACGTSDDEPEAGVDDKDAPSSSPSEQSPAESRVATCTLKGSESAEVTLEDNGDAFVMKFDGRPIPASGTALYSATLWDAAGENGVQVGAKYLDGRLIGYFAFDMDETYQTNLDGEPTVTGKTLAGVYPVDSLGDLDPAEVVRWSAAFSVDGEDVGMCPGGHESQPFPG